MNVSNNTIGQNKQNRQTIVLKHLFKKSSIHRNKPKKHQN